MGRTNKFTQGVFTNIVGDTQTKPTYDMFLNIQESLITPSSTLERYISRYKKKITKNKMMFEHLSRLETLIMQMRMKDNLSTDDIKFNVLREYIYARIPFYRDDKETKDVRVIVGLTEIYGDNPEEFYKNQELLTKAKDKLTKSMDETINYNIGNLNITK